MRTLIERLQEKYSVDPQTGCWVWLAAKIRGYGRIAVGGGNRWRFAHRISFEIHVGPIPEGMLIDHVCRNRSCINPQHLRIATHQQNSNENSDSFAAKNAAKTRCLLGHEFTPENTLLTKAGWRQCRECNRIRGRVNDRARRTRKKEITA